MSQSGTIVVSNITLASSVGYSVGGMVPGGLASGLASGTLGNPSSGVFNKEVSVSGFALYSVEFFPVGGSKVTVDNLVVEEDQPTNVSLAVTIT